MSLIQKLKEWLDENEDELKNKSDRATQFLEQLGHELIYTGAKLSDKAEEAFDKLKTEWNEKKSSNMKNENPYEKDPKESSESYFSDLQDDTSEEIEKNEGELSAVESLFGKIDDLIQDLKKSDEAEKPDERDHMTAINEEWKGMDDDFIKKAMKFADRKMSPGSATKSTKTGRTKGFEDLDGDGNDIIDDAILDS